MDNCTYNEVKLLHKLSNIAYFLEKYGKKDAKKERHTHCSKIIEHLQWDLKMHMKQLHNALSKKKL